MSHPDIHNALKIEVEKSGKEWRADAKVLTGMPPVGVGKTKDEAKFNLLVNLMYLVCTKGSYESQITSAIKNDWDKNT